MRTHLLRAAYGIYRAQRRLRRPILLGVRILLVQEGSIVLVHHTYQPGWYLPGGGVKRGETPVYAAMREAYEEVGARFYGLPSLMGLYANFKEGISDHIAVFVSDAFLLREPTDSWEIDRIENFALVDLPEHMSPGSARRILDFQAGNGPYVGLW